MRVYFSEVGGLSQNGLLKTEMDSIPRVDDDIYIFGKNLSVRTVVWQMEDDASDSAPVEIPYIYVVVGPPRP